MRLPRQFFGLELGLWVTDELRQSLPLNFTLRACAEHLITLKGVTLSDYELGLFLKRLRDTLTMLIGRELVSSVVVDVPNKPVKRTLYTNLTHAL